MFSKEKSAVMLASKAKNAVISAHIAMIEAGLDGMNDAVLIANQAVKATNAALLDAYNNAAAGENEERQDHLRELAFGGME